jgi:PhzF family phenazine biosynthesis protein
MSLPFVQVDAFTSRAFSGNPAAVMVLPSPRDDRWMQQVAQEMNLSETAFLTRRPDGSYDLRWFSPAVEIALCGHATLASAHALWESGQIAPDATAQFHTRSGLLTAARDGRWIELNFPATPEEACDPPPGLAEALGVRPQYVGRTKFDYLVEVPDEDAVRHATPDFGKLAALAVRGVMITSAASAQDVDFVSRFFAPGSGINEDPVTGSAHAALVPYWTKKLGRHEFTALQASSRSGVLHCRQEGDRALLGGHCHTLIVGQFQL